MLCLVILILGCFSMKALGAFYYSHTYLPRKNKYNKLIESGAIVETKTTIKFIKNPQNEAIIASYQEAVSWMNRFSFAALFLKLYICAFPIIIIIALWR